MIGRAACLALTLWTSAAPAQDTAPTGMETRCQDTAIPASCIVAQTLLLAGALPVSTTTTGFTQDMVLILAVDLQVAYGSPTDARQTARRITGDRRRLVALAAAGDTSEALALLATADTPVTFGTELLVARALLSAGDIPAAQATFATLDAPTSKDITTFTRALATATALSGDIQGGYDLLSAAGVDYYDDDLTDLIRHQAATGDIREAISAVKRLRAIAARGPAFRAIALVQIADGDLDGARKTAARIPDDPIRAAVLAAAGDLSLAKALTPPDPADRAWALALAGDLDQALKLADPTTSPENPLLSFDEVMNANQARHFTPHGNAYLRVIDALAQTGHYDQALHLAAALAGQKDRDFARTDISRAAADLGDIATAIQILTLLEDPEYCQIALAPIDRAIKFTLRRP